MKASVQECEAIWDRFLQKWPADNLTEMTLEEYVSTNDQNTFAYWLEHETKPLVSIRGGDASKFGIYKRASEPKGQLKSHIIHGKTGYSWNKNLGKTQDEAFNRIKVELCKISLAALEGDLDIIQRSPLAPTLKWKAAFLYQNREKPSIINIMQEKTLRDAANLPKGKSSDCHNLLMVDRGEKSVLEYGREVWSQFNSDELSDHIEKELVEKNTTKTTTFDCYPTNKILYGPPGTGKTFHTVEAAVLACEPGFSFVDREELKGKYDELCEDKRIQFVTFHQSFSYEEFVEGLKATTEDGQIKYEIEDGIFKRICIDAEPEIEIASDVAVDVKNKTIWKMSLGNTQDSDNDIYDFCIEKNEIRLGYGSALDFTGCKTRQAIEDKFITAGITLKENDYGVTSVNSFINGMKEGDLVIITDGNLKFRAIAEVRGEYKYSPDTESGHFVQCRSVIWHRVYEKSLSYDKFMSKKFSQMTIYQPTRSAINLEKLQGLLTSNTLDVLQVSSVSEPRVLIIDEINRGNISKIFGELITLIEPSKRAGQPEALSAQLPYSKEPFSVPSNLHIIGTMNTADRSLAMMDTALRRRFDFIEMMPDYEELSGTLVCGVDLAELLEVMNERIEYLYDREHMLGHAFFIPVKESASEHRQEMLMSVFKNKVIPLLEEYFYEDWAKIRLVLGDTQKTNTAHQFVTEVTDASGIKALFGNAYEDNQYEDEVKRYQLNQDAFTAPESYQGILGKSN